MKAGVRVGALLVAVLAIAAAPASAQVGGIAWDSPLLVPPRANAGFGVFLVEPEGGDIGVVATWRAAGAPSRLQFRLGIAEEDDWDGGVGVFGGVDVSGLLTRASDEFPVDVAWVTGAGLGVGDAFRFSAPLGLIVGRTFSNDDVAFTPYLSPRVVLDAVFGEDVPGDDDDLTLDLAVDLGIDLRLAQGWTVRFGGTLGDHRDALAVGVVF